MPITLLNTSLTFPKDGFTVYIRVSNITARITETPVKIATQPNIGVENLFIVISIFLIY
jgi:hypothetical protein